MNIEFFLHFMLQNKLDVLKQALKGELSKQVVIPLFVISILCLAVYGLTIGFAHSFIQGVTSSIKLPILFYLTCLICFPTLYIFLSLLGLNVSLKAIAQYSLVAICIMAIILLSFTPISVFFLIVKTDYQTFKLINVGIMSIAGFSGVYLFYRNIIANTSGVEVSLKRIRIFIKAWLVMFALIGTNLGFVMSPFFRNPGEPFLLFIPKDHNFFTHIISILFGN